MLQWRAGRAKRKPMNLNWLYFFAIENFDYAMSRVFFSFSVVFRIKLILHAVRDLPTFTWAYSLNLVYLCSLSSMPHQKWAVGRGVLNTFFQINLTLQHIIIINSYFLQIPYLSLQFELEQRLAYIFFEGPDTKYFWLCLPYTVYCVFSSAIVVKSSHRQYINQ